MRNDQLSTTDFVATGEPHEELHDEPIPTSVGGARMVKEAPAATPLFPDNECHDFRTKWDQIQIGFVDEPRKAVQEADSLVAQTMKRLAEIFSDERKKMEGQWSRGDDVSTEDLRMALQRYRSFFNRLLSM
jgi:hypothetical protein